MEEEEKKKEDELKKSLEEVEKLNGKLKERKEVTEELTSIIGELDGKELEGIQELKSVGQLAEVMFMKVFISFEHNSYYVVH